MRKGSAEKIKVVPKLKVFVCLFAMETVGILVLNCCLAPCLSVRRLAFGGWTLLPSPRKTEGQLGSWLGYNQRVMPK